MIHPEDQNWLKLYVEAFNTLSPEQIKKALKDHPWADLAPAERTAKALEAVQNPKP